MEKDAKHPPEDIIVYRVQVLIYDYYLKKKTVKIFVWIFTKFYFIYIGAFNLNHDCSQIQKHGQTANDYTGLSLAYIKTQQDYDDWKFLRGTYFKN